MCVCSPKALKPVAQPISRMICACAAARRSPCCEYTSKKFSVSSSVVGSSVEPVRWWSAASRQLVPAVLWPTLRSLRTGGMQPP
ncbi:hypothetical protein WJX82_005061 [Trebouxia sp. C0006]